VLPLTFHIETGLTDPEFDNFKQYFLQLEQEKQMRKRELEDKKQKYHASKDDYDSEEEFDDEEEYFQVRVPKNIWIMKPGENSNRGSGIAVFKSLREIQNEITSAAKADHTHIV
jgi:hypothetical protein